MGLRETLEAASPGPWQIAIGDDGELEIVHSQDSLTYITALDSWDEGDAHLIALAPELAALVLAQNEEIQEKAKQHHRSWGHEKSFAKCMWPICESAREFAARLDQLGGKEQTDGPTE